MNKIVKINIYFLSPSQHSLQSKEEKLIVYRKQLEAFKDDSTQSVLDFPVTLTSHDRMVIHEVGHLFGDRESVCSQYVHLGPTYLDSHFIFFLSSDIPEKNKNK